LRTHERMSLTPNLPQVWRREAPGRPQRSPCTGWRPSCSESCDGNWPEAGHCPSHSTIETCWSVLRHKGYSNVTISLLNIIAQLNQARINAQQWRMQQRVEVFQHFEQFFAWKFFSRNKRTCQSSWETLNNKNFSESVAMTIFFQQIVGDNEDDAYKRKHLFV